jgi:hypothetical protein
LVGGGRGGIVTSIARNGISTSISVSEAVG